MSTVVERSKIEIIKKHSICWCFLNTEISAKHVSLGDHPHGAVSSEQHHEGGPSGQGVREDPKFKTSIFKIEISHFFKSGENYKNCDDFWPTDLSAVAKSLKRF